MMETFEQFLAEIPNSQHQTRTREILHWIKGKFPHLDERIAWNQPMFTDHGTFIIGISLAKGHMAIAPERVATNRFSQEIKDAGYEHTLELIRIPWDKPIDYALLERIIQFNIEDKKDCLTFWRKLK